MSDTQTQEPAFGIHNHPQELWFLADHETGNYILATDCAGKPLLVYTSWDDAVQGADAHERIYGIDCQPVRIRCP